MTSLKKLAAASVIASAAFMPLAALADDAPANIDTATKVENAEEMAACVADSVKTMLGNIFERESNPAVKAQMEANPGRYLQQQMQDVMAEVQTFMSECAASATGLPEDQIPAMPAMPSPNASNAEFEAYIADAQAFGNFMVQHVDESTFNREMQNKFAEIMNFMMEKLEQAAPQPAPAVPAAPSAQ